MLPTNINKNVADTASVYENNLPGLQQKAKSDQKSGGLPEALVELLALNDVKTKVDASKRQIMLDMAKAKGPDTTVAEQLKKGVIDQAIGEKVKGVAGVLQQQANQKNKYMNNLVNKGAQNATQFARPTLPFAQQKPGPKVGSRRMPQQIPTQYAAMGGGIAPVPRQNFRNMAQGGIIGFEDGGWLSKISDKLNLPSSTTLDLLINDIANLPAELKNKVISLAESAGKKIKPTLQNLQNQIPQIPNLQNLRDFTKSLDERRAEEEGRIPDPQIEDDRTWTDKYLPHELKNAPLTKNIVETVSNIPSNIENVLTEGEKFLTEGEYSSPDPSVLGGGNQNVNAAFTTGLGNLRSDLFGAKKEIDDLKGGIANADKHIAQNEALRDRFLDESIKAQRYLEGMPIPGTEQDLVDRNTAIANYADKQYGAAADAIGKFKKDKKQFEGELGGIPITRLKHKVKFMQEMDRKARMGDPEAIAFKNQQGKANIQKGLAGFYGDQSVDPSMMKMVEAQQFTPHRRYVDTDAIEAAGENKAGIKELIWGGADGYIDGNVEQLTKYPTYSPANLGANVLARGKEFVSKNIEAFKEKLETDPRETIERADVEFTVDSIYPNLEPEVREEKIKEMLQNLKKSKEEHGSFLDPHNTGWTDKHYTYPQVVEKGLDFLFSPWADDKGRITEAGIPPVRDTELLDSVDVSTLKGPEAFRTLNEIDTSKEMKVIDEQDSDTFDAMGQVDKYADTNEGGKDGAAGSGNTENTQKNVANAVVQTAGSSDFNVNSMGDVIEFYNMLEERAGKKSRKDAILFALSQLSGYRGFSEFTPAFQQYTEIQKANARALADKALNYGLQKEKLAVQRQGNAIRAAYMNNNNLMKSSLAIQKELNDQLPYYEQARRTLYNTRFKVKPGFIYGFSNITLDQVEAEIAKLQGKGSEFGEDEKKWTTMREVIMNSTEGKAFTLASINIETLQNMLKAHGI